MHSTPQNLSSEQQQHDLDLAFQTYALTIRKFPTRELYQKFLQDRSNNIKPNASPIPQNFTICATHIASQEAKYSPDLAYIQSKKRETITNIEAEFIQRRFRHSNVVSITNTHNQQFSEYYQIKQRVLERLKSLHVTHPEKIYGDCISFIRDQSVIVMTINSSLLQQGVTNFQPLNMWKRGKSRIITDDYRFKRDITEQNLFNYLDAGLKEEFLYDVRVRPNYAALLLLGKGNYIKGTSFYDDSFIVLKDIVKYNALFCPGDSLEHRDATHHNYQVCTIDHLEILLWQCPIPTLKAIVTCVTTGALPKDFDQNVWTETKGGYLEVFIPPINIFDPNMIEHIHINPGQGYILAIEDKKTIEKLGVSISSSILNPYHVAQSNLLTAILTGDEKAMSSLLRIHPSLKKIPFSCGSFPLHTAVFSDHLNIIQTLAMNFGVDINQPACGDFYEIQTGDTALHVAVKLGYFNIVKKLLELGANVDATNAQGETALFLARKKGFFLIVETLIAYRANTDHQRNDGATPFFVAVETGNIHEARNLIQKGVHVNQPDHRDIKQSDFYTMQTGVKRSYHEKPDDDYLMSAKRQRTDNTSSSSSSSSAISDVHSSTDTSMTTNYIISQNEDTFFKTFAESLLQTTDKDLFSKNPFL